MYSIDATLKGKAPILFNRYTEKTRPGKLRHEELLEEATRRVYRDESQALVWPMWNIQKCLMDGARLGRVKHGKASIVPYVQALILVEGDGRFDRVDYDGLHICPGRIPPRTGPMVTIYRPKLDPGWLLTFRLIVADTTLAPATIQEILNFAGLLAGMGAWRPTYGRFVLEAFAVTGMPEPATDRAPAKKRKQAVA